MDVTLTPFEDLSQTVIEAWDDLARRAAEPNPFMESAWVMAASRYLGETNSALLSVSDGGRLMSCLPVRWARSWRKIPLGACSTWRHDYCYLGTPLLDLENSASTLDSLVGSLKVVSKRCPLFVFEWIGQSDVVGRAIEESLVRNDLRPIRYEQFMRAFACRSPSNGQFPNGYRKDHLRRLAQSRRAMDRQKGPSLTIDRSTESEALDRFIALEAAGWKGRMGTSLASRPGHAEFFKLATAELRRVGKLQLFSLEVGGRPVAMQCNVVVGPGVFLLRAAYDESLARFSPGVQLELDILARLQISETVRWIDTCADPDNSFVNGLFPERRALTSLVVPLRGGLMNASLKSVARVRRLKNQRPKLEEIPR